MEGEGAGDRLLRRLRASKMRAASNVAAPAMDPTTMPMRGPPEKSSDESDSGCTGTAAAEDAEEEVSDDEVERMGGRGAMMEPVEETSTVNELLGASSVTRIASRSTTWNVVSVGGEPTCCRVMVWTRELPSSTGEE